MKSYLSSLTLLFLLFLGMTAYVVQDKILEDILTNHEDYDGFLDIAPSDSSKFFELWDVEIQSDSTTLESLEIVAELYTTYFHSLGNVQYLKKAEQTLKKIIERTTKDKTPYYVALSRNYMAQHRFMEALGVANGTVGMDTDIIRSRTLLFDVHMALGNYDRAKRNLDDIKEGTSFEYVIRLAKWNSHKGNLSETITLMEKAKSKAVEEKDRKKIVRAYKDLADYYEASGKVQDAYEHYVMVLEVDPYDIHAKKSIAKIVYAHGKNPMEAMRILDAISTSYNTPDYYLLRAEIADYQKDSLEVYANIDQYYRSMKNPDYGDMHNDSKMAFYLNLTMQYDKAIELAKKEVMNRATPKSYDLLAYSYFKNGEMKKARAIMEKHLPGKTYEPSILYHKAEIYKAIGDVDKVASLKKELLEGVFALGPSMKMKVVQL